MIDSEIRDQAYQFFLEEVPELLQILETGLLLIKQECSSAQIHDLMRAAHSLKGGAATVGLDAIKTIAHRLESILRALHQATEIDTELEILLLQAFDCLKEPLNQELAGGSFDSESALAAAEPVFTQIETRLGDAIKEADNYVPSSSDLGVDMVSSIFEVDVAQGIERLTTVLANPQDYEVVGELRAQAEVFSGFAEIVGLPGFGAISKAAIAAIDAHPEQILQIIPLALADFQAAREAVLAGDRTEGGSPSAALTAFSQATQPEQIDPIPTIAQIPELEVTEDAPCLEELFSEMSSQTDAPEMFEVPPEAVAIAEEVDEVEACFDPCQEPIAPDSEPEVRVAKLAETEAQELLEIIETDIVPDSEPEVRVAKLAETEAQELLEIIETNTDASVAKLVTVQSEPKLISQNNQSQPKSINYQTSPKKSPQSSRKGVSPNNWTVKVDSNRLERMNNFVGELVINRNSLELQHEQLERIVQKLQQRLEQFQTLANGFQELSDEMLIAPTNSGLNNPQTKPLQLDSPEALADFDPLEIDSYGNMHFLLQGVIEEIMQLEEAVEDIVLFSRQSNKTIKHQQQNLNKLRDELMWARMLPLERVLSHFPRGLRDLSLKYQKPVDLKLSGTDVLVDKGILEKLHDPLLHLLRNAFDHGIEPPEVRRRRGKPETGQIEINAYHRGNQTLIEMRDDGRGLDLEKITQRAIDKGWLTVDQLMETSKEELLNFIFEPGFSTAKQVSELSGRGVGLDVVSSQLQAVKGTVTVSSIPGRGTTFTLRLPLTLTIANLLVCSVGSTMVAFPAASIHEIVTHETDQTKQIGNQRFLSWREQLLPVYPLADLLEYKYPLSVDSKNKSLITSSASEIGAPPILIIRGEKGNFALEIEGFGNEQELVIKPLEGKITPPEYIYGCTILGDGSLVPAIDAPALLAYARDQKKAKTATKNNWASAFKFNNQGSLTTTAKAVRVPTVLVVDDSAMMRRTLSLTLQKVGYRILAAKDGWEAIEILQQNAEVQLIVSDLDMPNFNGFELLNQLRQDDRLAQIPVVMLTSRSQEKHRQLAMHLGATAYLTKPYIEQEFLAVLQPIISDSQRETTETTRTVGQDLPSLPYAV